MKTSQLLCIALAAALAIALWHIARSSQTDTPEAGEALSNQAYDCIMTRTSCRAYTDRRPTEGQIDSLLHAAMAAPTAANQQAWQLVVITDRDIIDSVAHNNKYLAMAAQAPLVIVPCGDLRIAHEKAEAFWPQDLSALSENILLAAHSMGLGAVWCGIYPDPRRVDALSRLLELPDSVVPLCVIPIGYPKSKLTPKKKFDPEKVHYNGW